MSLGQKHLGNFDITNQFHHVFWLGDLNYRVQEDIQVSGTLSSKNDLRIIFKTHGIGKSQKILCLSGKCGKDLKILGKVKQFESELLQ